MKVFMEEINDAEANLEKLIKIIESLGNDFVSCVKKAEFEKDMTQVSNLISKANTWSNKVKNQDAKKLDETFELLKTRKRKLE